MDFDKLLKAVENQTPIRVYWRTSPGARLSFDDATNIKDAERMKAELEKEGYESFIIVAGRPRQEAGKE